MNSKKKQTQKQCFGPGSGSALIRMYLPGPDLHKFADPDHRIVIAHVHLYI